MKIFLRKKKKEGPVLATNVRFVKRFLNGLVVLQFTCEFILEKGHSIAQHAIKRLAQVVT